MLALIVLTPITFTLMAMTICFPVSGTSIFMWFISFFLIGVLSFFSVPFILIILWILFVITTIVIMIGFRDSDVYQAIMRNKYWNKNY